MKKQKNDIEGTIKTNRSKLVSLDEENRTIKVVISDESEDRHGEVVVQEGWDFSEYLNNPVVFWGHNSWEMPIATVEDIQIDKDADPVRTVATVKFPEGDTDSEKAWNLIKQGVIRATSVGFINTLNEGAKLLRNKLLELSFVGIPANPNAVTLALKSGRITNEEVAFLKKTYERELKAIEGLTKDDDSSDNSDETARDDSQSGSEGDSSDDANDSDETNNTEESGDDNDADNDESQSDENADDSDAGDSDDESGDDNTEDQQDNTDEEQSDDNSDEQDSDDSQADDATSSESDEGSDQESDTTDDEEDDEEVSDEEAQEVLDHLSSRLSEFNT